MWFQWWNLAEHHWKTGKQRYGWGFVCRFLNIVDSILLACDMNPVIIGFDQAFFSSLYKSWGLKAKWVSAAECCRFTMLSSRPREQAPHRITVGGSGKQAGVQLDFVHCTLAQYVKSSRRKKAFLQKDDDTKTLCKDTCVSSLHKASRSGLQVSAVGIGWAQTLITASCWVPTSELKSHCSLPSHQPRQVSLCRGACCSQRSLCLNIGLDKGIQYSISPPLMASVCSSLSVRMVSSRDEWQSSLSPRDTLSDVWLCECTS